MDKNIATIFEILLLSYFVVTSLYLFVFSLTGKLKKSKKLSESDTKRRYAVLIPAYKEDEIIVDIIDDALNQNYPQDLFDVILIADGFKEETLCALRKKPIQLIEINDTDSTKTKAIQTAFNKMDNSYDIGLILDADNVMESNLFHKLNRYFDNGVLAIQAHRIAKNTDTSYSILDGVSEEINNTIFRKGHRSIGLSSALIGSAMAFKMDLLKELMVDAKAVGGFDKELEFKLLRQKILIEYAEDAYVYDEKVQKAKAFANQRKRWIIAQLEHLARNIVPGIKLLFSTGNIDYFNKVIQMTLPPRSIVIGLIPLSIILHTGIYLYTNNLQYLNLALAWCLPIIITGVAFLIAMPKYFYSKETFLALKSIPKAFMSLTHKLLFTKIIRNKYIHTEHHIKTTESN